MPLCYVLRPGEMSRTDVASLAHALLPLLTLRDPCVRAWVLGARWTIGLRFFEIGGGRRC